MSPAWRSGRSFPLEPVGNREVPRPHRLRLRNLPSPAQSLHQRGVAVGLIPSAAEIWRDRLPRGAESWDQAAFIARAAELEGVEPRISRRSGIPYRPETGDIV